MWRVLAVGLAGAALSLLAGCGGGGGTPTVLTGNYFPHAVGAAWTYTMNTAVESDLADFHGTGTIQRRVLRQEDLVVDGASVPCYVIGSTYTVIATPTAADGVPPDLLPFVQLMFSATAGGLRPVEAYYRSVPPAAGSTSRRETLVALRYAGGPRLDLPAPRLHFSNPPLVGNASTGGAPLLAHPLAPPLDCVSDARAFDKLRQYGYLDGPLGNRYCAIYIDRFEGWLHAGGQRCAYNGRAQTYFQQGVGMIWCEWAVTLSNGAHWARVAFVTANPTYAP